MIRHSFSFLAVVTFALALLGCGREFVINTAQVSAGVALLDIQFDAVTQTVGRLDLAPDERVQMTVLHQQLSTLRTTAHDLVTSSGGLAMALVRADDVRRLADAGKASYITARQMICPQAAGDMLTPGTCPRLIQLSPAEQELLIAFDLQARLTNKALQELLNAPSGADITQTVSDLLTVGAAAARIGALL